MLLVGSPDCVFLDLDFLFTLQLIIYSPPPSKVSANPTDKAFLVYLEKYFRKSLHCLSWSVLKRNCDFDISEV